MFKIINGLLQGIKYLPSPNFNQRPANTQINLVVIHNISLPPNQFGGTYIEQFFTNQLNIHAHPYFSTIAHLHVSAHLLIQRNGHIIQFVPFHCRAWHAGKSSFQGQDNCNDYSIGIELEGTDNIPYTQAQYTTLLPVIQSLQQSYPAITIDRIVGHNTIAPQRKTDPGSSFDWQYLQQYLPF